MRLIDAEIPLKAIHHIMEKYIPNTAGYRFAQTILRYIEKAINNAPTIDPVRYGKWVTNNWIYGAAYCSECNFEIRTDNTKYCPNCGAKMDGE